MNSNSALFFDGLKSIPLNELPEEAWKIVSGGSGQGELRDVYRQVPWLFRGVELRAQGVASLPFGVFNGNTEIDSSKDWQNKVGFLPDPKRLFYQLEASLTLVNRAYAFREYNLLKTLNLRYLVPTTIREEINEESGTIQFIRSLGGRTKTLTTDDIIYFWKPSAFTELGYSDDSPAQAALNAANVVLNLDKFVSLFFKRGAIKATLLTVEGSPKEPEKDKLKAWWNRMFSGVKEAWQTEVVNSSVKPVIVGEGVKELENETLTNAKRQDIATALGIPQTKLFSDSASGLGGGGVVEQDDIRFLNDTIIPEATFIADTLNEQHFRPSGLSLRFKPETLDAFQADEADRAGALDQLVSAINNADDPDTLRAAMMILGYEIPQEVEPLLFKPRLPKPQPQVLWTSNQPPVDVRNGNDNAAKTVIGAELVKWQRKAIKHLKEDRRAACEFESDALPRQLKSAIAGALEHSTNDAQVRAVFTNAMQWVRYP